jgi:hypothetical protein
MIVSYETLRTMTAHLAQCSIGLLLCDEGHRLKNSGLWQKIDPDVSPTNYVYRITDIPSVEFIASQASRDSNGNANPGLFLFLA